VNFDYDEDQVYLKGEARRFLEGKNTMASARAGLNDPTLGHDAGLWGAIAEQGWLGAAITEENGGLGLGHVTLCALAEELGRSLAPTAFSSSVYLFAEAIQAFGPDAMRAELLPQVAGGEIIGALAASEGPGSAGLKTVVDDGKLSGVKIPVIDGMIADRAVVLAARDGAPGLWLVDLNGPGVTRESLISLDPCRGLAKLTFDKAPAELISDAPGVFERLEERAAVMLAFEQLGGAQRCMEMARDYVLQRYAFGRPIGSYQAIKHRLADMAIKIEMARSNVYFAAAALESGDEDLPKAAAAARIAAGEAYWFATKENIQLHGGIGFTWEMDCHLFYRRAQFLNLTLGSPQRWKRRLSDLLFPRAGA
jgi:alkylation response protein AidB-like acyl-CoA dehydrogenase